MNCFCAIYVDRNQRTFLAQMTSFVVRYDVIYHSFLIILIFLYQGLAGYEALAGGNKMLFTLSKVNILHRIGKK